MSLDTVLISAGVAAGVTLVIEYSAKPWLEARKDRILEGQRHRREAAATLMLAHSNWGLLRQFDKSMAAHTEVVRLRAVGQGHIDRLLAEIKEQSIELLRIARLIADDGDPLRFETLTSAAGLLEGAVLVESRNDRTDQDLDEGVAAALLVLRTNRRSPAGKRARIEARQMLNEVAPYLS